MSLNKEESPNSQMEAKYIDKTMKEIFIKHGHLAMVFDYLHEDTPELLKKMGYSITTKRIGEAQQITVINNGKK